MPFVTARFTPLTSMSVHALVFPELKSSLKSTVAGLTVG